MRRTLVVLALLLSSVALAVPAEASSTILFAKPCRVLDTRNAFPGYVAGLSFKVRGNPAPGQAQGGSPGCGVPDVAEGVVLNVTVITPSAAGHAILWASDQTMPGTSTIVYSMLTNNNDGVESRIAAFPGSSGDVTIGSSASAFWVVDLVGYHVPNVETLVGQAVGILFGDVLVVQLISGIQVKAFAPSTSPNFHASWVSKIGAAVGNCTVVHGLWFNAPPDPYVFESRSLPIVLPGNCAT